MKKVLLYLVLIAAVIFLGEKGNGSEEVGQLQPVQLIMAQWTGGELQLTTDTGHSGTGGNVKKALNDMNEAASGRLFLDTADYLLISKNSLFVLEELSGYLRPSCAVCQLDGNVEPAEAAEYLSYHIPELTLAMYEAGERTIPVLSSKEGRMKLEQ